MAEATEEKIRELAYQLWERDGSPEGKDHDYWHAAKELLAAEGEIEPQDETILQVPIVPLAGSVTK